MADSGQTQVGAKVKTENYSGTIDGVTDGGRVTFIDGRPVPTAELTSEIDAQPRDDSGSDVAVPDTPDKVTPKGAKSGSRSRSGGRSRSR